MKIYERRLLLPEATKLELRDDATPHLTGYASTFGNFYDMGWYRERVDSGAFDRTLGNNPDVRLLVNHAGLPLARTTSGTLQLSTDAIGLRPDADLDGEDPDVRQLVPKMKRRDVNQMSFGFRIFGNDGDEWNDDFSERTLKSLDLNDGDVSVVTFPANPDTTVGVRSLDALPYAVHALDQRGAGRSDVTSFLASVLAHFEDRKAPAETDPVNAEVDGKPADDADEARAIARRELRKRQLSMI